MGDPRDRQRHSGGDAGPASVTYLYTREAPVDDPHPSVGSDRHRPCEADAAAHDRALRAAHCSLQLKRPSPCMWGTERRCGRRPWSPARCAGDHRLLDSSRVGVLNSCQKGFGRAPCATRMRARTAREAGKERPAHPRPRYPVTRLHGASREAVVRAHPVWFAVRSGSGSS